MLVAKRIQQVGERAQYGIDYTNWLQPGETVTSAVCTVDAGTATVDTITISNNVVKFFVNAGTFQDAYNVIVQVATSLTQQRFDQIAFFVDTNGGPVLTSQNAALMLSILGPTGPGVGATGPTGPNSGLTGATGAAGPTGFASTTGPTGATGPQGAQGSNGVNGLNGTNGATGVTGAQGNVGLQGAQGVTGPTGNTGPAGFASNTGSTGPTGSAGNAGATGPTGTGLVSNIPFVIDGGGSTLTTGVKGYLPVEFACTINLVELLADVSGSVTIDIWKTTYANFDAGATHPVAADSITASAVPALSSATKYQDATLTGWTTAIAAGDILAFDVKVASVTLTRVTASLKVTRS